MHRQKGTFSVSFQKIKFLRTLVAIKEIVKRKKKNPLKLQISKQDSHCSSESEIKRMNIVNNTIEKKEPNS